MHLQFGHFEILFDTFCILDKYKYKNRLTNKVEPALPKGSHPVISRARTLSTASWIIIIFITSIVHMMIIMIHDDHHVDNAGDEDDDGDGDGNSKDDILYP